MKQFWKNYINDKWALQSLYAMNMLIVVAAQDLKVIWGRQSGWLFIILMFVTLFIVFGPIIYKLVGGGPYDEDRRIRGVFSVFVVSIILGALPIIFEGQYWLYPIVLLVELWMCVSVGKWARLREGEEEKKSIHVNFKNNSK